MPNGIRLGSVLGIRISLDYTWFIVFALFAWSLAYGYFPFKTPGLDAGTYLFMGTISAILLFVCVLIHELSHSYTANRLGLDISEIKLFIFGGVAQLTKEPEDASVEFRIAVAGPLASAILAFLFWGLGKIIDPAAHPIVSAIFSYLALINVILLIFNMIPGFPLDGGRVFRALWWARTGDINEATKVASQIGKGFAIFLIVTGFLQVFMGNFTGGLWSVLIGVFLQQAAESGYQQVVIKNALKGVKVRDMMTKEVVTINEDNSISDTVENFFLKYHHSCFPVRSDGRIVGMLSFNEVKSIEKEKWNDLHVKDVIHKNGQEVEVLKPDDSAIEALTKLTGENCGKFPVMERGQLVGIISRQDILKILEFRTGLRL